MRESSDDSAHSWKRNSGVRLHIAEFTSEPPPSAIACIVGSTVPLVKRSPPSRIVRDIEIAPSIS